MKKHVVVEHKDKSYVFPPPVGWRVEDHRLAIVPLPNQGPPIAVFNEWDSVRIVSSEEGEES